MKIANRMLTIATVVLWVIILFFSVTAVYSVMNVAINIGEVQMLPSGDGIEFSLPFSLDNGGFYELADLNLTTRISDPDGNLLDVTETLVPSIPQGTTVNASHTIPINMDQLMTMDHARLLLNDSSFNMEVFAGLNFARAVPVQLSTNITLPWGAPLANFSIGSLQIQEHNRTHSQMLLPITFENHAVLEITGNLRLDFYDSTDSHVATGTSSINVEPQSIYARTIYVYLKPQDADKLTSGGKVHVIFETAMFNVDWWENLD